MGVCTSKEEHTVSPTTARIARPSNIEKPKASDTNGSTESSEQRDVVGSLTDVDGSQSRKQSLVPSISSQGTSLKNALTAHSNGKDSHEYTKVLLLGTGESGKSTILQQLRILHSNGFTEQELYDFKPFIFSNIVSSAKDLVNAYKQFEITPQGITQQDLDEILNAQSPVDPSASLDQTLAKQIQLLWRSSSTKDLMKSHRQEFYLMDSASYFFEELGRISQDDYMPNTMDIVRTRKKTSGIFDLKFELQGLKIHIFDVGGQRSERKKWIYCFDNVASIIFCVALSEYDQVLLEDKTKNRLEESLALFDSVVNSRWFSRCSIILFLNKIDVFIDKLPYSPLEAHFPDYKGGDDANKAAKYILWRFTRVNRSGLPIYPYITQATDTNNMKLVFVVVRESIFSNILQDTGLLS
jgi:guanine nucleotide-binding protein subunit alpha